MEVQVDSGQPGHCLNSIGWLPSATELTDYSMALWKRLMCLPSSIASSFHYGVYPSLGSILKYIFTKRQCNLWKFLTAEPPRQNVDTTSFQFLTRLPAATGAAAVAAARRDLLASKAQQHVHRGAAGRDRAELAMMAADEEAVDHRRCATPPRVHAIV